MTTIELKKLLIHRISEISDISFLEAIKTILDAKTNTAGLIVDEYISSITNNSTTASLSIQSATPVKIRIH